MFADKVGETCSTTGAGTYSLGGAIPGSAYRTWLSQFATTTVVFYYATRKDGSKWELGYGTLTTGSPATLSRNLLSSSSGALIAWVAADQPYSIFSVPVASPMAAILLGQGFTARPAWAQTGLRWPDFVAGIGTRIVDKLYNGTVDVELGRYEGVPGMYIPSPRHYWVDQGAANYTLVANDIGKVQLFNVTAANRTLTLPAGATAGHGFRFAALGYGGSTFNVVLTPNGADAIDQGAGGATLSIPGQRLVWVEWDGAKSQWRTDYYTVTLPTMFNPGNMNGIINGACIVAQGVTANLSTSRQLSKVDGFAAWASGGVVGAGTIIQDTASAAGRTGHALKLSGVTLTGSGKLSASCRMEALFARRYKNATVSFAVLVHHDIGSGQGFTVTMNKANAADNFAAVTAIGTSGSTSVPNTTATVVKYENVAVGDCSNGLEFIVEGTVGAITTKNISFTEWIFAEGATAPVFTYEEEYGETLRRCQRYYFSTFPRGTEPATNAGVTGSINYGNFNTGAGQYTQAFMLPVPMRAAGTGVIYNPSAANNLVRDIGTAADYAASSMVTAPGSFMNLVSPDNGGIGLQIAFHATIDARL